MTSDSFAIKSTKEEGYLYTKLQYSIVSFVLYK